MQIYIKCKWLASLKLVVGLYGKCFGGFIMLKFVSLGCASLLLVTTSVFAETLIREGSVQVTTDEFAQAIEFVVPEQQQKNMHSKEQNMRGFLADYFTLKVMADAAQAKGLDKDPSVQARQAYSYNRLLTEALINDHYVSATEPEYEVLAREAYMLDPKRFDQPERVHAEHILIAVNSEQDDASALKKAQELYARAKENKGSFAELAKKHSDDPSAVSNSGNLGFFEREAMVKPFSDAAFAMKKGEISQPIKTSFGYHIIHLLDQRKAGAQSFDDVKAQLIDEQKRIFKDAKRDEIVSKFRSSSEIKVDEEAMKNFVKKMQQK